MTVHQLQKRICWAIGGQRVRSRVVAVQPVLAILVSLELAAQVVGRLVVWILEVVFSIGASLPDVEDGTGNRLSCDEVRDGAVHLANAALRVGVLDDGAAVVPEGRIGRPKGTEDGRGCGIDIALGDDLVRDLIH